MLKVILFILLAVAVIMGGAMILLETAKPPKLPEKKKLKSPEEWDKEDEDFK